MTARLFALHEKTGHVHGTRVLCGTGRHERVLERMREHEGEGGPFVAPAQKASFPFVNTPSRVHTLPCKKPPPGKGTAAFQQRRTVFFRKNRYFQRLLYLTDRPSVRSTSLLTRASISS